MTTTPALRMPPEPPPGSPRSGEGGHRGRSRPLFDPPIVRRAIGDAFAKLGPRHMLRNPVMFVVFLGAFYAAGELAIDAVRPWMLSSIPRNRWAISARGERV